MLSYDVDQWNILEKLIMKLSLKTALILASSLQLAVATHVAHADNSHKSIAVEKQQVKPIYQSEDLVITKLAPNVYQHTSYFKSETWGKVPSNGMVVINNNEAVVVDTPVDDKASYELISWIEKTTKAKINAVVSTHFHEDTLGGTAAFQQKNIPTMTSLKTLELAKGKYPALPKFGFENSLRIDVGDSYVEVKFLGEGHTTDNVVAYYPTENVLFGGCLVKELDAKKGNLDDANVEAWSTTIDQVMKTYPNAKIVIPGHGQAGDQTLLHYTKALFMTVSVDTPK